MSNDYNDTGLNSLQRGEIGEARFVYEASKLGWMTGKMPQHSPYDFVLDTGTELLKIQVKNRVLDKNGVVNLNLKPSKYSTRNNVDYDASNVDAFVIYCPDLDMIAFLRSDTIDWSKQCLTFRNRSISPPRRKSTGQRFFEDFEMK